MLFIEAGKIEVGMVLEVGYPTTAALVVTGVEHKSGMTNITFHNHNPRNVESTIKQRVLPESMYPNNYQEIMSLLTS